MGSIKPPGAWIVRHCLIGVHDLAMPDAGYVEAFNQVLQQRNETARKKSGGDVGCGPSREHLLHMTQFTIETCVGKDPSYLTSQYQLS